MPFRRDGLYYGVSTIGPERRVDLSDYQLALKHFLRTIEMQTDPNHRDENKRTRAWWGIKLVSYDSRFELTFSRPRGY